MASLQDLHSRHPTNRQWGQHTGYPLWVQILINISHLYWIFTTDTTWRTCKGNACDVPCGFKFWYICIYIYITTGSSQLTPYGSHIRIIHGAPLMSSMYYITIGHFFSYICTLLFFLAIIFSICLTPRIFSKSTFICVLDFWQYRRIYFVSQ